MVKQQQPWLASLSVGTWKVRSQSQKASSPFLLLANQITLAGCFPNTGMPTCPFPILCPLGGRPERKASVHRLTMQSETVVMQNLCMLSWTHASSLFRPLIKHTEVWGWSRSSFPFTHTCTHKCMGRGNVCKGLSVQLITIPFSFPNRLMHSYSCHYGTCT